VRTPRLLATAIGRPILPVMIASCGGDSLSVQPPTTTALLSRTALLVVLLVLIFGPAYLFGRDSTKRRGIFIPGLVSNSFIVAASSPSPLRASGR
jgi:hypothetical protein